MSQKHKSRCKSINWIVIALYLAFGTAMLLVFPSLTASNDLQDLKDMIEVADENPYPTIDWTALQAINKDVIGWITIPGTNVNSPVLAAHFDERDYYLDHALDGTFSRAGSLYLDAWANGELVSANVPYESVVYGHHMPDGSMFASIANYGNAEFAQAHEMAYVQTPGHIYEFAFDFAEVIPASEPIVPSGFGNMDDYRTWMDERRTHSKVDLKRGSLGQTLCLVTCSYTTFDNERTAAYFEYVCEIQPGSIV